MYSIPEPEERPLDSLRLSKRVRFLVLPSFPTDSHKARSRAVEARCEGIVRGVEGPLRGVGVCPREAPELGSMFLEDATHPCHDLGAQALPVGICKTGKIDGRGPCARRPSSGGSGKGDAEEKRHMLIVLAVPRWGTGVPGGV